jgi:hypothetical protein
MTDIPCVVEGIRLLDKEAEVESIGHPAGIAVLALRPSDMVIPSKETLSNTTELSCE